MGALLTLAAAIQVQFVSGNLHGRRVYHDETVAQQHALLERRPLVFEGVPQQYPMFRNRLLVPVLQRGLERAAGLSPSEAFIAVRLLTAWAALMTVWCVAVALGVPPLAAAGALALTTHVLVLSFARAESQGFSLGWTHRNIRPTFRTSCLRRSRCGPCCSDAGDRCCSP